MGQHLNRITFKQRVEIMEGLADKINKREDGLCEYIEGWDDTRAAALLGVTPSNVLSVRREIYGNLFSRKANGSGEITALRNELSMLVQHVKALDEAISKVQRDVNAIKLEKVGHVSTGRGN